MISRTAGAVTSVATAVLALKGPGLRRNANDERTP